MDKQLTIQCLNSEHGRTFSAYQADCVDFVAQMPDNTIDFTIYSPPFSNLYTYSDMLADMGNCEDWDEFFEQYRFLTKELLRVTKDGRLSAVHCMDIPNFKWRDGFIGLRDFSGNIIEAHQDVGWVYHSRITIWKDPVVEMQRTKALGLLWKQIRKDSAMCRVGNPDYLLLFRKPGDNENPIEHKPDELSVELWQRWASPVWMDIRQTNVLNRDGAREVNDEKHICPLQLDVIKRCVTLWSNPGDVVFSPFMGIGSEGYQALKFKRKFIGTELKDTYFKQAVAFLRRAEAESETLFDTVTP